MANELKNILKLLIENKDKQYSIRKISIEKNINYKSAYEALAEFEEAQNEALELAGLKADSIIEDFHQELKKRSRFQYDMGEQIMQTKARISFERAKNFVFEMNRLLD